MINYQLAILIAIFAFVYSSLLTKPNQLFNSLYNKLYDVFKNDQRKEAGMGLHPLFMVLIHCEKCIAGQAALWLYIYFNGIGYFFWPIETLINHILFVTFTILIADILRNTHNKIYNNE